MFDTLMKSEEILSLVTLLMQFFNSLLMLLLNINAMFFAYVEGKIEASDCQ